MPKQTFYKLPQEKQERILAAAKREFTQVRYSDVSINQIVREAGIPRGSFYQYFEDKKDIFLYFLKDYKKEILGGFSQCIRTLSGNFFAALDVFVTGFIEETYREPERGFRIIVSEPWIFELIWNDMLKQKTLDEDVCRLREEDRIVIDWSHLDLEDQEEVDIFVHILGAVIHDTLCDIFLGNEMPLEEAEKIFHERLGSLRRHYEKRVQQ